MAHEVMTLPIYDPQGVMEAAMGVDAVAEANNAEDVLLAWIMSLGAEMDPKDAAAAILAARGDQPPGGGFHDADRLLALLAEVRDGAKATAARRGGHRRRGGAR